MVNLIYQGTSCMFAPFFPSIASQRGISTFLVGATMSINSVAFMSFSYIIGGVIWAIGRRMCVHAGLLITAGTMIGFGSLYWISNKILFVTMALILRYWAGVGQAMVSVACYSMAAIKYKDTLKEKMGLMEAAFGSGFLLGPAVGGIVYELTNYYVPFFGAAGILILFVIILKPQLSPDLDERIPIQTTGKDITYGYLFRHKRLVFAAMSQFFNIFVLTYGQPIYEPRLQDDYNFSVTVVGLCFAIPTAAYIVTGPFFLQILTKKFEYRAVIMLGFFFVCSGALLIGPSDLLGFPSQSRPMMFTGFVLLGVGQSFTVVPVIPEMIDSVDEKEAANDKVSAIFHASGGAGQIFAPLIAGYLYDNYNFNLTMDVWAVIIITFNIIYILLWEGFFALWLSMKNTCKCRNSETSNSSFDSDNYDKFNNTIEENNHHVYKSPLAMKRDIRTDDTMDKDLKSQDETIWPLINEEI